MQLRAKEWRLLMPEAHPNPDKTPDMLLSTTPHTYSTYKPSLSVLPRKTRRHRWEECIEQEHIITCFQDPKTPGLFDFDETAQNASILGRFLLIIDCKSSHGSGNYDCAQYLPTTKHVHPSGRRHH
jgi:hypothetical protein